MFELSKILGAMLELRTGAFIILLLGTGLLWTPWRRTGRGLVTLSVLIAAVFATTSLGPAALARLEYRFPAAAPLPDRVDGIVVLGGDFSVDLVQVHGALAAAPPRLMAFVSLARRYPDARLVFSGGSGRLVPGAKEADLAPQLFAFLGLEPERVIYERDARNTQENAVFGHNAAAPKPGETWLLVTTAFHMPRAMGTFRHAGWTILPYPVDFRTTPDGRGGVPFSFDGGLAYAAIALREAIGLAYYRLRGHTDALFPAP